MLSGLHTNFWYVSCEFVAPSFAHVQYLTNIFYRYGEHLEVISGKVFSFSLKIQRGGLGIFSRNLQKIRKIGKGPPCEYFQQILFSDFLKIVL